MRDTLECKKARKARGSSESRARRGQKGQSDSGARPTCAPSERKINKRRKSARLTRANTARYERGEGGKTETTEPRGKANPVNIGSAPSAAPANFISTVSPGASSTADLDVFTGFSLLLVVWILLLRLFSKIYQWKAEQFMGIIFSWKRWTVSSRNFISLSKRGDGRVKESGLLKDGMVIEEIFRDVTVKSIELLKAIVFE